MALSLMFYVSSWVRNKPMVKSTKDVHVIVKDGCNVYLDKSDNNLTKAQKDSINSWRDSYSRERFLFYMNKGLADALYFKEGNGEIKLHCPVCKNDYVINKEKYNLAYKTFLETGKESYLIN